MAPRFVLLERKVQFVVGENLLTGGARCDEAQAPDILDPKTTETALQAMKPELSVVEPPEVSRLTMVHQTRGVPPGGGHITSTDKFLVVLCAVQYTPGFTRSPSSGCYLVYDASTNSLTAVPQIPPSPNFRSLGRGTAILSRGEGTYVMAEIGTRSGNKGMLYLWQSTSRQWELKSVRLPPQVVDHTNYFIHIDLTFSYADSCSICWVDLLQGVLVCHLFKAAADADADQKPKFTFVPLPEGFSIDVDCRKPRPRPEQFRTMSCVNGVIKFVAVVGLYENNFASGDNVVLRSWSLSPDLKEWTECSPPLAVQDLWASESFRERNLPKLAPTFPVLSVDEDEIVYLCLKEIEYKNAFDIYGQFDGVDIVKKAHHSLRFDMIQNKVLHCTKITQGSLITSHWPTLLTSEFTAYLHDHEGERC